LETRGPRTTRITLHDHRLRKATTSDSALPVDQHVRRNNGKSFDRAPAGFHRRPVNVDPVDLFHIRLPYADRDRRFADRSE
jgi:hypothetical protein